MPAQAGICSITALPFRAGDLCKRSIDRSLILLRQKPRPEHRGILRTLDGLASLCRERGHFGEANQYYKRVLAVREELLGPSHPRVAATRRRYAALLQEMERESDTRQVRYNGDGESK